MSSTNTLPDFKPAATNPIINWFKDVANSFNPTRIISSIFGLFLVLYAGLAAPKLPKSMSKLFGKTWFKIIILTIIAFMATKDIASALIGVVALVVSMQTFKNHEMKNEINAKLGNHIDKTNSNIKKTNEKLKIAKDKLKKKLENAQSELEKTNEKLVKTNNKLVKTNDKLKSTETKLKTEIKSKVTEGNDEVSKNIDELDKKITDTNKEHTEAHNKLLKATALGEIKRTKSKVKKVKKLLDTTKNSLDQVVNEAFTHAVSKALESGATQSIANKIGLEAKEKVKNQVLGALREPNKILSDLDYNLDNDKDFVNNFGAENFTEDSEADSTDLDTAQLPGSPVSAQDRKVHIPLGSNQYSVCEDDGLENCASSDNLSRSQCIANNTKIFKNRKQRLAHLKNIKLNEGFGNTESFCAPTNLKYKLTKNGKNTYADGLSSKEQLDLLYKASGVDGEDRVYNQNCGYEPTEWKRMKNPCGVKRFKNKEKFAQPKNISNYLKQRLELRTIRGTGNCLGNLTVNTQSSPESTTSENFKNSCTDQMDFTTYMKGLDTIRERTSILEEDERVIDANPGLKPCDDCDEPVADRSMKPGGRGPPKLKGPYEYRYKNDGHVYKMPESERAGETCSSKNTHLKHGFKGNDIRTASLGKNPYK